MKIDLKDARNVFAGLLQTRVFEGSCVVVMSDDEYRAHFNKGHELFQKLLCVLSKENRELLQQLESEWASAESLSIEYAYTQGMIDGVLLGEDTCSRDMKRGAVKVSPLEGKSIVH